jgi:hypothetical protein
MTLKIGDRVRFLNEVGGGIISAYLDEKMVEVQTDDGFEIPIPANELLLDTSADKGYSADESSSGSQYDRTSQAEEVEVITLKSEDYKFASFKGEVILAIVPDNDKLLHVSDLMLYLINDSNYSIQYITSKSEGGVDEFVKVGTLEPETKLKLRKYNQSTIGKIKKFRIQGHFYKEGLFEHKKAIDKIYDISGFSFYKANTFSENDYFENNALVFKQEEIDLKEAIDKLSESDIIKVTKSKEEKQAKAVKINTQNPDIIEVDLHIEEIVDNHKDLSNGEIVEIQMGRFETSLETALRSNSKKIVFIHGVGNGRLKHELTQKLQRKYPDLKYQDASFKEYGYGATLVYLK